jgi:hypothetical protein
MNRVPTPHHKPAVPNSIDLRHLAWRMLLVLVLALIPMRGVKATTEIDSTEKQNMVPDGHFMPLMFGDLSASINSQLTNAPRPLGNVVVRSGPTDCGGQSCYLVRVRGCSDVVRNADVYVKVGEPTSSPAQGTILFASGLTGNKYFGEWGTQAQRILAELRAAGFRTVQIKWKTIWFYGAPGALEGTMKLACRSATVARWVYDNFHPQDTPTPYCFYGHSNGASQGAYAITQYGLSNIFSTVMFNSGPNWTNNNEACLHEDPAYQSLWFPLNFRKTFDKSFGFASDGSGACARQDPTFHDAFYNSSVVTADWSYVYTNTMVAFIFGANDASTTRNHGMYYYDAVVNAGSPLVRLDVVPGAGHDTFKTVAGADTIRDVLISECRLR